jgi:2-methylisocitrate lyase-like PEP mutase family enzyme
LMATTTPGARLRALLRQERLLVAPGVFDGISAALVAGMGFDAAYMTGAGVTASGFGYPDIGLVTQTEMSERARLLVRVLGEIPLIADADTGYGAPINAVRTLREYEQAGVAAIQIEDQAFPKKCGHLPDKELIPTEKFVRKLDAVLQAREDPDLVVIARTDARAPHGLDAAIERAGAYRAAGADVIFVEAPQNADEVERIAKEVDAPLLINLVPGGLTPDLPHERLQQLGFAIAIHPTLLVMDATAAMIRRLAALAGRDPAPWLPETPTDLFNLVGLAEWSSLGERFGGDS